MGIPANIIGYLGESEGEFRLYSDSTTNSLLESANNEAISLDQLALAMVVKSNGKPLMIVLRADQEFDSQQLADHLGGEFELCDADELNTLSSGCDSEWLPPLPQLFGLPVFFDMDFCLSETIFFPAGAPGHFIQTSGTTFQRLLTNASQQDISQLSNEAILGQTGVEARPTDMKTDIMERLPAMPAIAAEILRLRENPYSQASELAAVIEQDHHLSEQLIRYASSPLYGHQGTIESVEQAISSVLGMDFGSDVAFGLAVGKALSHPTDNETPQHHYWDNALYPASLAQVLCNAIDFYRRPSPGIAYLSGLLHNLGSFLMEQLYPGSHEVVAEIMRNYPELTLLDAERSAFGTDHIEVGVWLMERWDMPKEIVSSVQQHNTPQLDGDYAIYANLVCTANILLKRYGIGDAETVEIEPELLESIGLDIEQAEQALATVIAASDGLSFMAGRMAA